MYPKFIVLQDLQGHTEIRFGLVSFHSDLIEPTDKKHAKKCIGGGLIEIVDNLSEVWYYGSSTDFGKVDDKILNNIKLTSDNYIQLNKLDKEYFQKNVDYFKKENKDFSKYKFVVKNW